MALKLNGNTNKNNASGTAYRTLHPPTNDAEIAAMKIARTVIKNLFQKGINDDKFRSLKTSNPKVAAKLLSQPQVVGFLIAVGFTNTGEALSYQGDIDVDRLQQEYHGVDGLLRTLQPATSSTSCSSSNNKKSYIDPTKGSCTSIKAQMRAKEEAKQKARRKAETQRRKELLKGFDTDKQVRKQPGWKAKLSGANRGAAPSMQGSTEGNANLRAH